MDETPRKVLVVESGRGYGGSAFSLLRLVKSLDRQRYEPHVVVAYDAPAFDRVRALAIPVTRVPTLRPLFDRSSRGRGVWNQIRDYSSVYGNLAIDTLYNGIRMMHHIRRNGIQVVHLNNGLLENLSAAFAARLLRVPCVAHVRGTEPLLKVEKYVTNWISAFIVLNRAVRDDYVPVFGRERVHLIHNGVDLDALRDPHPERVRAEFGIAPGTFAIGTFARLVEGKGIPEFIAVASRLRATCRASQFFVVGDGGTAGKAFEAHVKELARQSGVDGRLVFTGWRNDRLDIMAAMDAVLQISTTFPEGMSLAPLEAMALGKPIIVTNIPGYEVAVDDGVTGFIVEPGDIDALTEKVSFLVRNKDLASQMGRAGHCKALRDFDIRRTARQVEQVYDQVLSIASEGSPVP